MSTSPIIERAEYLIIKAHNDSLSEGIRDSLIRLRAIPRNSRPAYVNGQIAYFIHVLKALKWSTAIAGQKAKITNNAESTDK